MSTSRRKDLPGHHHTVAEVRAEQESIDFRMVIGVGVGAVVTFVIGIVCSTVLLNGAAKQMRPTGPPPVPSQVNQYEVGIVNQRMFVLDQRAAQKRLHQMERLQSYGWVDRQAGTVHIPIDVAMERLVAEPKK